MSYNTGLTNVQALSAILDHAVKTGFEDTEVLEKVRKHIAQLAKPKKASNVPSKTQLLNANLKEEVFAFVSSKGLTTAKDVVDGLGSPYVTSAQKATILLGLLVTEGRLTRVCIKGRAMWTVPSAQGCLQ
jgi:hypothetical protein